MTEASSPGQPGPCTWPGCLTGGQRRLLAEDIRREMLTGKPCTIYREAYPVDQKDICGCHPRGYEENMTTQTIPSVATEPQDAYYCPSCGQEWPELPTDHPWWVNKDDDTIHCKDGYASITRLTRYDKAPS